MNNQKNKERIQLNEVFTHRGVTTPVYVAPPMPKVPSQQKTITAKAKSKSNKSN